MKFCPSGTTYGTTCKYAAFSCPSGTTYGKTCVTQCPNGYELKNGPSSITCQSSGAWTTYRGSYCSRINKPPSKVKKDLTPILISMLPFSGISVENLRVREREGGIGCRRVYDDGSESQRYAHVSSARQCKRKIQTCQRKQSRHHHQSQLRSIAEKVIHAAYTYDKKRDRFSP